MTALAVAITDYLRVRRAVGFKLHEEERTLRAFAQFLGRHRLAHVTIARALEWATQAPGTDPRAAARRLTAIRGFTRYHHALDPRTEVPPIGLLPDPHRRPQPYVYSEQEVRRLLRATWRIAGARGWRRWTYWVFFGLLAVTGLRVGEARDLRIDDVDLQAGVLTIRGAKFGKSRLVPLHPTTRKVLAAYLARRARVWRTRSVPPFVFLSLRGRPLHHSLIHRVFYAASYHIGLRRPGDHHGPRLHDLRHRFAVQTLLRWYRAGEDPERQLPVLSAYLGHVSVADTYWYLTAWPALMHAAMRRVERRWEPTS